MIRDCNIYNLPFKNNITKSLYTRVVLFFIPLLLLIIPHITTAQENSDSIPILESNLETAVNYYAADSIIMDMEYQKAYLYEKAHVDYGEIILDACYIEFDFQTKEVFAKLCFDSLGKKKDVPILTDGSTETVSDSLRFNFETKRGITYQVKLQEGESFIHGDKVKRQENGDIHINKALYTTCDLDHPHYYFKLRKAIIIPDDKIVSGPINLFIADVPTPLGLPFAFIPNKKDKNANGVVIPTYGESPTLGFYLLAGGYYHKFKNNKLSTSILGDIYSKGSWGLSNITNYKVKYKYNGNFQLNYRQIAQGEKDFETYSKSADFFIRWTHNQDPKAKPGTTFRASINAGTTTNFRNDFNDPSVNNYLSNTFNSNIAWSKQFKRKISSNLNVNLRHNQNSTSNLISFTLPEATYNVNRFYPFKMLRKQTKNKNFIDEFINQTNVNYSLNFKNETTDSIQNISFNNLNNLLNNTRYGMRHNINTSSSIKFFKKTLTINPSYQYSSFWYMEQIQKQWNQSNSEVLTDTINKFSTAGSHNLSMSATTKIYGFYKFAKFLSGKRETKIRHTITPNINFSYRPDNGINQSYQADTSGNIAYYSPFSNGIYGSPSSAESGRLGFNLINALEMKRKNLNDTTGENPYIKTKLLENLSISSGYDFIKDSFNLDNINISGRTSFGKNFSMRFGATLDPYWYNEEGYRKDTLLFSKTNLGTFKNANLALSLNLRSKKEKKEDYKSKKGSEQELDLINSNKDAYIDFNVPWTLNIDYKIDYRRIISPAQDTVYLTQSIGLRGDFSLTKNWKVDYLTNYDFTRKEFSFTSIGIARDLHCWEIGFNWIPFGVMKSYNIHINVKSSLLQDLRLQRRRTWYDNGIR